MAKNTRKGSKQKQVSLATTAGVKKKSQKKKKKQPVGVVIVRVLVAILASLSLVFIGVMVFGVVSSFSSGANAHDVDLTDYDTTPEAEEKKVSYFLVGLLGEDENAAMDMLTLVCYDKKAKAAKFLQLPADTYVGNSGAWAVTRLGNVWNNPTPLTWCETCRGRVFEPEQQDGKHTVCDTPLTEKTGSAVESLVAVFNDQLSMPVDNYFILHRETLIKMVDLVGGIDVELESAITVDGVPYAAGKRILDGKAALYYTADHDFNNTPAKDITRLNRQRKVWTALLQRLSSMDEKALYENVVSPIMAGADPIRTNTDAQSVAKMMAGIYNGSTENMTYAESLAKLLVSFKKVDLNNATFYTMPGKIAKLGTATYFGIGKEACVKLLQGSFNPYGLELKEDHLMITELTASGTAVETNEQTMQALAVEQSGATTSAPATTTTAAQ